MLAERLLRRCARHSSWRSGEVTVSVGVAVDGEPHSDFEQLLSDADVAMYAVKAGGRDGVAVPVQHAQAGAGTLPVADRAS